MVRPATEEELATGEDYYKYKKQASLTANTPTTVLEWNIDTGERLTLVAIGTNGGSDITLRVQNKNDVLGEEINGLSAPFQPKQDHYLIGIPLTFEEGDHFKLIATSAAGASNTKFFAKGTKKD